MGGRLGKDPPMFKSNNLVVRTPAQEVGGTLRYSYPEEVSTFSFLEKCSKSPGHRLSIGL